MYKRLDKRFGQNDTTKMVVATLGCSTEKNGRSESKHRIKLVCLYSNFYSKAIVAVLFPFRSRNWICALGHVTTFVVQLRSRLQFNWAQSAPLSCRSDIQQNWLGRKFGLWFAFPRTFRRNYHKNRLSLWNRKLHKFCVEWWFSLVPMHDEQWWRFHAMFYNHIARPSISSLLCFGKIWYQLLELFTESTLWNSTSDGRSSGFVVWTAVYWLVPMPHW